MTEPLKLRIEIEAMCAKAGLDYRDVTEINLTPMEITFHSRVNREHSPVTRTDVFPYVFEEDTLSHGESEQEAGAVRGADSPDQGGRPERDQLG